MGEQQTYANFFAQFFLEIFNHWLYTQILAFKYV